MSKEKVFIVDKEDNILDTKWRTELSNTDRWRIIAIWVENSLGEILLQQRSLSKDLNPGLWTPGVVGTVAVPDSYEETAYKELSEELGISDTVLTLRSIAQYKASVGYRNIHTFQCVIDRSIKDFVIQQEEVEQIKWITPLELRRELKVHPEKFTVPDLWDQIYNFSTEE